ncbi:MAG: LysR family transcriptional regulator [Verrucomicrobiota bacterium]
MNIHHLELFYYVARHGGIMEAVRNIPYGIQQPAVSGQVAQLEEYLGVTLFQRRPFSLTAQGAELYDFIRPFFDNLGPTAEKIRGGLPRHLKIAASEIVLRDYLPAVLQELRRKFTALRVSLREGYHSEVIGWMQKQEVDVFVGLLAGKPPAGIHSKPMFRLPLVLLVPRGSELKSAAALWKQDRIGETLITVPSNQPICRAFQDGLARLKVDWFGGIEVSSVEMVETYVANGYGIGVTVGIPGRPRHPEVRALPLEDFDPILFGVLWQGRRTPLLDGFLTGVEKAVAQLKQAGGTELQPVD